MNLVSMDLALRSPFLAEASILLILLAGTILLFWSFREKYLLPWIAGWLVYGLSKVFSDLGQDPGDVPMWTALAYASFVIAAGLFAAGGFLYVHQRKLLLWLGAFLIFALTLGLVRALWLPNSAVVRILFDYLSWRLVMVVAAAQMLRFAWGRANIGRWSLAVMLLSLHPETQDAHALLGFDVLG